MKVIAEVGSNWKTKEDCLHAVNLASACGADAVKFQMFTFQELYGFDYRTAPWYLPDLGIGLPKPFDPAWLPDLKIKADAAGIEFMCTAFSPSGYEIVNQYVKTHKVASAEMSHVRILEKLQEFGKPVILSTGAHGSRDIDEALKVLNPDPHSVVIQVTLMYCVAAYPAHEIDFRQMQELFDLFGSEWPYAGIGYSDHSTDVLCIPKLAQDHAATVLEKHFNPMDYKDTPDAGHSLNCDQFKKMVKHLRGELPFAWGSGEENEMVTTHNRRLLATKGIEPGDLLEEGRNFGIFRSLCKDTNGLSPFAIGSVNGRASRSQKRPGEAIGLGDFE